MKLPYGCFFRGFKPYDCVALKRPTNMETHQGELYDLIDLEKSAVEVMNFIIEMTN